MSAALEPDRRAATTPTALSPRTVRLLLACARVDDEPRTRRAIGELAQHDTEWDAVRHAANRHRILPVVAERLTTIAGHRMPHEVRERFRADHQRAITRSGVARSELARLLTLLDNAGIAAVPYLGPAFATPSHPRAPSRRRPCLELLVRSRDAREALDVIRTLGYRRDGGPRAMPGHDAAPLHSSDGSCDLRVRWYVAPPDVTLEVNLDEMWQRLERRQLGNTPILTLAREDLLLLLCVNGACARWSLLASARDVAKTLLECQHADWDGIEHQARMLGARRMLALGLYLASELLGAPIPPLVRRHIDEDPMVPRLAGEVRARFARETDHDRLDAERFRILVRERMRERLPHAMRFVSLYTRRRMNEALDGAA